MPICLTGMHRSHTSMMARILKDCGVYLGPDEGFSRSNEDNLEGFWEDLRFQSINERLLEAFGLNWDRVDLPKDWLRDPRINDMRSEAGSVIAANQGHEPWAWKDPRSCVTFSFWKELIDGLRAVILVRSPVEVARSLLYRRYENTPYEDAIELWASYYNALEQAVGDTPNLVVHSDSLFAHPREELARVCEFLDLSVPVEALARALSSIRPDLTAARFPDTGWKEDHLPDDVRSLYGKMCSRAGPIYAGLVRPQPTEEDVVRSFARLDRIIGEKTEQILSERRIVKATEADRDDLRAEIERITATKWHRLGIGIRRFLRK